MGAKIGIKESENEEKLAGDLLFFKESGYGQDNGGRLTSCPSVGSPVRKSDSTMRITLSQLNK